MLISEVKENEIDKITDGVIAKFRNSFVKWEAVVMCAANKASRAWLRDRLPQLVPWEGAKLRMVPMGELQKPQRATLSIPGKYGFPTIKAKLQRRCPDLEVEGWRLYACNSGGHGDAAWTSVVVGLPESSVKAFQVRQNRIPCLIFLPNTRTLVAWWEHKGLERRRPAL